MRRENTSVRYELLSGQLNEEFTHILISLEKKEHDRNLTWSSLKHNIHVHIMHKMQNSTVSHLNPHYLLI